MKQPKGMLLAANLVLFLGVANWVIAGKEDVIANGRRVLLKTMPVDPISLIQGFYMDLRYELANDRGWAALDPERSGGRVVVALDGNDVATFRRLEDGKPLAPDEQLLRYRVRYQGPRHMGSLAPPRVAAESFFFQEGEAKVFERFTRYAELRVDEAGNSVLVALVDENFQRLPGEHE